MWTRTEVKTFAKSFLKTNYWLTFVVLLIVSIVLNGFNQSGSSNGFNDLIVNYQYISTMEGQAPISVDPFFTLFKTVLSQYKPLAFIGFGAITFTSIALSILTICISFLLEVGKSKYFLDAFKEDVNISKLFFGFNTKDAFNIIKIQFFVSLKLVLWFLLLFIPGLIKAYEYRYIPYILAENPGLSSKEVFKLSKEITDGEKASLFILDLSFFPYHLLSLISFGLASYFIAPYIEATDAKVYTILRHSNDEFNVNFEL